MTETGTAGNFWEGLLDKASDLYVTKRTIDLESRSDDRNIPDRTDIDSGSWQKDGLGGGSMPVPSMTWVVAGIGLVVAGALIFKLFRG